MGVCVGEQMLFDLSEENDERRPGPDARQGGALPARRQAAGRRLALQGAADGLEPRAPVARPSAVGTASPDNSYFYFVHSYYAVPENPAHTIGEADYGAPYCCAVARDNLVATQFHPEKSAAAGLRCTRISSTGIRESSLSNPIHQLLTNRYRPCC
jgi:glutamine amidotransferase